MHRPYYLWLTAFERRPTPHAPLFSWRGNRFPSRCVRTARKDDVRSSPGVSMPRKLLMKPNYCTLRFFFCFLGSDITEKGVAITSVVNGLQSIAMEDTASFHHTIHSNYSNDFQFATNNHNY